MCCSKTSRNGSEALIQTYQNRADRQARKAAKQSAKREGWLALLANVQTCAATPRTQKLVAKYQAKADRRNEKAMRRTAMRDHWLSLIESLRPITKPTPAMASVPVVRAVSIAPKVQRPADSAPPTYKEATKNAPSAVIRA